MNGRRRAVSRDELGLMWLRPECAGPCDVDLEYNGGWELRICRYVSYLAMAVLFAYSLITVTPAVRPKISL